MLRIIKKEVDVEGSKILFEEQFDNENFNANWKVYGGEWWIEDGWLTGKNPKNCPGMIVSKEDYFGNVLIDFEARTVLPCTHDIDVMWNGSWDEEKNQRGIAYVAGLEGWWEGKVGIEKSPKYELIVATPLFDFEPGHTYHIQAGSIDGHCFVFVDGRLILEVTDPDPIDASKYGKVGFEAYSSFLQVKNLKVYSIKWNSVDMEYAPEF